ncbi:MAG TPA: OB-fold nucleic acid binding domain-containing protein, partial [Blastocatellia bacterium]|nr:OB-fold nucleic acid binding domain-containing protein [Blastocatellia bacterium]
GMTRKGISGKVQQEIIEQIASFALYGFPESHAASFALIAYASAYLKCHYLAAFTAATLNNQPMGFYQPATLIKDAQRHGLKIEPIDITRSDWLCTIEPVEDCRSKVGDESRRPGKPSVHESQVLYSFSDQLQNPLAYTQSLAMRLGMMYVKGLRKESAEAIVRERARRSFSDIDDLHNRVPELRKDEMRKLAEVGALNFIKHPTQRSFVPPGVKIFTTEGAEVRRKQSQWSGIRNPQSLHRRSALWQVERAARPVGPLLKEQKEQNSDSPLPAMTIEERVNADFRGTGMTIGRHPLAYRREELKRLGVKRAIDLREIRNGIWVRVAGWVIVRQRPGTAKGFMFLSMEDETGIANVIVTPDVFDKNRLVLVSQPLLLIDGVLQNQDGVIHVKARRIQALSYAMAAAASHDFH